MGVGGNVLAAVCAVTDAAVAVAVAEAGCAALSPAFTVESMLAILWAMVDAVVLVLSVVWLVPDAVTVGAVESLPVCEVVSCC